MTWQQRSKDGLVQTHIATKTEIDELRAVVARNLADAGVSDLSADNRLGIAYEAVLVSCKMVVHAAGYRVRSGIPRAHAVTLECAELALGPSVHDALAYFDTVRRRRNTLSYDTAGLVSDHEAKDALKQALAFRKTVDGWFAKHHPRLV